jgi:hypothetical protein
MPVNTAPVEQPQIGLLDELGWTPAAVPALVGQEPARDYTQVLVDDCREHRERIAVPLTPSLKQPCQIPVARHVGRSVTGSPSGVTMSARRRWQSMMAVRHDEPSRRTTRRSPVHLRMNQFGSSLRARSRPLSALSSPGNRLVYAK